jgi:hypothetical protein
MFLNKIAKSTVMFESQFEKKNKNKFGGVKNLDFFTL